MPAALNAYIIIGNPNTRKASLVRSLTGCFNRSVRDIVLQGEKRPQRFYARVGTLQDTRTSIDDFVQEVSRGPAPSRTSPIRPICPMHRPTWPPSASWAGASRALRCWGRTVAVCVRPTCGSTRTPPPPR